MFSTRQVLSRALFVAILASVLCSLVLAQEERPDCQSEETPCSGVGRCKLDGVCECPASRVGWTCALKPPELRSGWVAPGLVTSGSFQRYHIPEGKWSEGARIYISAQNEVISIIAGIGELPVNGEGAQFVGTPLTSDSNLELVIDSAESTGAATDNKDLYIMVRGPDRADASATYTIKYEEDTSILGMPEWLFILVMCVVGVCCIILTAGCIFGGTLLYKKWQRQKKVNNGFALTSFDDNTKDGSSSADKDNKLGFESAAAYDRSSYGASSAYQDASQYGGSVAGSAYGGSMAGSAYGGYNNAGGSYNSAAQYSGGSYANASQYGGGSQYGGSQYGGGSQAAGTYATELQRGGSMQPAYGSTAQAGYGGSYGQY